MSAFVLVAVLLCVLAAALLVRPLWWPFGRLPRSALTDEVQLLSLQLQQLGGLHRSGALSDEQYGQSKALVERKLIDALTISAAAPTTRPEAPSQGLAAVLVLFLSVVAASGYAWLGSPSYLSAGPGRVSVGASASDSDDAVSGGGAASASHALKPEQVSTMIDQLAQRLKSKPDDPEGWMMLARSYVVIGNHAQAVTAFKQAALQRPDDADLLADYADALAMANNRALDGEPESLVERALQIDPKNPKALALAGTIAFDKKNYKEAVRYWEHLVATEPADSPYRQQIQGGIAEARQLAGMPAPAAPTAETASVPSDGRAAAEPFARISGTVSLAPTLKDRVRPDDTLFVFARAADGSRMPLAILRKRVRDLPFQFTLDDSMAMSPDAKLSGASRVVVGARISRSGNAMPQEGDLQGITSAMAVGSTGLRLLIDQEVAK